MKVTLKLFASLSTYLPPEARTTLRLDLEVEPGSTVADLIRRQGVPEAQCAIVLRDGVWVAPAERATLVLEEGTVLAIWPPVAGG